MIEYHGDRLVPPELCKLLYHAVPKKDHVPVRFFNRHDAFGEPTRGKRRDYSTPFGIYMDVKRPWIGINLNAVYYKAADRHPRLAASTAVWRTLVEVCLHEFGHSATRDMMERMNRYEYDAVPLGRVYRYTEQLAEDWKDLRLARILKYDPRLGEPRRIMGYLSALLARRRVEFRKWITQPGVATAFPSVRAQYVKEQRCWRAGAQLTSGDVLRKIGLEPHHFTNAYRVLRRASEGVGVDYIDRAGRRHKLYIWGDVPILAKRLEERYGELRFRHDLYDLSEYGAPEAGESYSNLDDSRVAFSQEDVEWDDLDIPF